MCMCTIYTLQIIEQNLITNKVQWINIVAQICHPLSLPLLCLPLHVDVDGTLKKNANINKWPEIMFI